MKVQRIIERLGELIASGEYEPLESDRLEIKDNSSSSSDWKEVYKSVCAFLNTDGGILILGIKEDTKNKKYVLKGYQTTQEDKLKEIQTRVFKGQEGQPLDLKEENLIHFKTDNTLEKPLLLIYVDQLPEEKKYAFYKRKAYERILTGDHVVSERKIAAQNEYKQEVIQSRELLPVPRASLSSLNVDKLNEYIQLLNREVKTESLKADIDEARSFLHRKYFVRNSEPTVLGVLVCGDHPEDLLGNRCQADCYVLSETHIAESKQIIRDNILNLMEKSVAFVQRNVQVGIRVEKAGSSQFEYPRKLVRESVNNALAHRDYAIEKYISIRIQPGTSIEIRNPGRFKASLLIELEAEKNRPVRRIIPSNPKPQNPKLAEVLKVFDKWEGQGLGMATLTNACLNNEIDLPYYKFFSQDELSLTIPRGKLLDKEVEQRFEAFSGYFFRKLNGKHLSEAQKTVLSYLYKSELANQKGWYTILLTKDNNHLEALSLLETHELVHKHDDGKTFYTDVYLIDKTLLRTEFFTELRAVFGGEFDQLSANYQEVLQKVYEYNQFSLIQHPSANQVGNALWIQRGNANVLDGFEAFKRKVRNIISQLNKKKFIVRVEDNPEYRINENFERTPSIFDS